MASSASSSSALRRAAGLIEADTARFPLVLIAATMAAFRCSPRSAAAWRTARHRARLIDPELLALPPDDATPRVIVAGLGRVGETVATLLERHSVDYIAVDADTDRVAEQRKLRRPVYWGDMTQAELLRRLHLETARALVVTLGDHAASDRLVAAARAARPDLLIIAARARCAACGASLRDRCERCGARNDRGRARNWRKPCWWRSASRWGR